MAQRKKAKKTASRAATRPATKQTTRRPVRSAARKPVRKVIAINKPSSEEAITAIFSYLSLLVFIPFFAVKNRNNFVKFHLEQGINLLIVEAILIVLSWFTAFIPVFGWIVSLVISFLWLLIIIFVVIAIIKGLNKKMWKMPLIGDIKLYKIK